MRLLIDGNILLDVLQKREPHYKDSSKVWKMCETDMADGYVSALTFANLVYVMRKWRSKGQTIGLLQNKRIAVFEDEAALMMGRFIYAAKQLFVVVRMPLSWYNKTRRFYNLWLTKEHKGLRVRPHWPGRSRLIMKNRRWFCGAISESGRHEVSTGVELGNIC